MRAASHELKTPITALNAILENIISIVLTAQQIKIENECMPIPPEKLVHIFNPFYCPVFARGRKSAGNVFYSFPILKILSLERGFLIMQTVKQTRLRMYQLRCFVECKRKKYVSGKCLIFIRIRSIIFLIRIK